MLYSGHSPKLITLILIPLSDCLENPAIEFIITYVYNIVYNIPTL